MCAPKPPLGFTRASNPVGIGPMDAATEQRARDANKPFVRPVEPNYVTREGKHRWPTAFEKVEHQRKVCLAEAEHKALGDYQGDFTAPSGNNMIRVTMKFQRGQIDYFVAAE